MIYESYSQTDVINYDENHIRFVFVYGSLKKGFSNHHIIEKAKFHGKVQTLKKYAMFKEKNANYPYMLNISNNKYHHIIGELYMITDAKLLLEIDKFEDAPEYYERKVIDVIYKDKNIKAFAYFFTDKTIPKNQSPLKEWKEDENYYLNQFNNYYTRETA